MTTIATKRCLLLLLLLILTARHHVVLQRILAATIAIKTHKKKAIPKSQARRSREQCVNLRSNIMEKTTQCSLKLFKRTMKHCQIRS